MIETYVARNWNYTSNISLVPHKIYSNTKAHAIVLVTQEEQKELELLLTPRLS